MIMLLSKYPLQHFTYYIEVWGSAFDSYCSSIIKVQKKAVRMTLNAHVNSVDELTHKRKSVARHGGERVGVAGEETTSQTAARWETRRCIRWTGVDAPMKNPSWPCTKADTPKAQYTPKCG